MNSESKKTSSPADRVRKSAENVEVMNSVMKRKGATFLSELNEQTEVLSEVVYPRHKFIGYLVCEAGVGITQVARDLGLSPITARNLKNQLVTKIKSL